MVDQSMLDKVAGWIAASRSPVVFSGAGVSRESGIPTFREASTGLWEKFDPQQLATVEGFLKDPRLVWEWYAFRRKRVAEAIPNAGHYALAELEKLLPGMAVITQNVDGLHRRAGSRKVIELHGNITRVKCFAGLHVYPDWTDKEDEGELPPRCGQCGSMLRPDVVWFGESLPEQALNESFQRSAACDLMLVVGTSGLVQPAASLPYYARRGGARIVEVNPNRTEITPFADILLQAPSAELLPELVSRVVTKMNTKGIF